MQRTFQTLAAFWCALALVTLVFSTMVEPMRVYVEQMHGVVPYLIRWFALILPCPIFYFLSLRGSPAPAKH